MVDVASDRSAVMVAVGVVGSGAELALDQRLLVIAKEIDVWLDQHQPDVVAIERVFAQMNVSTVMGVAQASGVVIAAAARRGIPVALHTPSEVKAAVTGSGRADKTAVTTMVTKILRLSVAPKPADAADALALAITHAWRSGPASTGVVSGTAGQTTTAEASSGGTAAQKLWREAEAKAKKNKERPSTQWR